MGNFEGNKYTMASTLHTCNYVPPNYYDWCDGGGCQTNAFNVNSNMMCPKDRCTINTNKPFTISHTQSNKGADGTWIPLITGFLKKEELPTLMYAQTLTTSKIWGTP